MKIVTQTSKGLVLFSLILATSGCGITQNVMKGLGGRNSDRILFDGERFRGGAKAIESKIPARFKATARPASSSLEGARQAAEFEGTSYCINAFGTSDITWEIGPDTAPETLVIDNDTVSFIGSCAEI